MMSMIPNPASAVQWNYRPMRPHFVEAVITLDYAVENRTFRIFKKTEAVIFNRLAILAPLYCSLILHCLARYEVDWMKNGGPISSADGVQGSRNDRPPEYEALIPVHNVTFGYHDTLYTCVAIEPGTNTTLDQLHSNLWIRVSGTEPSNGTLSEPQILTPLFEEVEYLLERNYTFDFICFAPHGVKYGQYFIFPSGKKVNLFETENGVTIGSARLFDDNQYFWNTTLSMFSDFQHAGNYTFVLEYESPNGSWIKLSRQLTLNIISMVLQFPEPIMPYEYRAYVSVGNYYQLTAFITPFLGASIEMRMQSIDTRCSYNASHRESFYRECGVLSMRSDKDIYFLNSEGQDVPVRPVAIFLKVIGSCIFRINTWTEDSTTPNITTAMEMRAMDPIFSTTKDGERAIIMSMPGEIRDSDERYLNDSIKLRCLIPSCNWVLFAWCKERPKGDCGWLVRLNGKIFVDGPLTEEPDIDISFEMITNFTMAFTLRIDNIAHSHAGVFGCGTIGTPYIMPNVTYKQFDENRRWLKLVRFDLSVHTPVPPYFEGFEAGQTQENFIKRGGTIALSCPAAGSPAPAITWLRYNATIDSATDARDRENSLELKSFVNRTVVTVEEPGVYECSATNRYGQNNRRFKVSFETSPSPLPIILSVLAATAVIASVVLLLVWQRRRATTAAFRELARTLKEIPEGIELDLQVPLNDQTEVLPYNTNYEIERDRFTLVKVIGDGEFGKVFRGELLVGENQSRYVAIKAPKDSLNPVHHKALVDELKIMAHLRPHVNVLALVGACTIGIEERRQLFVLTEYCEKGSLLSYLQNHVLDYEGYAPTFGVQSLLEYAFQAAYGMQHLAAWNIVHRDLALRNLLLTHRGVVKIADFGLSRQKETVYSYNKFLFGNVKIPVAWMAPESITKYQYTHKSDVWSFGIVLWEMFSCGRMPYSDIDGVYGMEIIRWLLRGNRLPSPTLATAEIYSLMRECWDANPSARPTFTKCKNRIARHLDEEFPSNYTAMGLLLSESFRDMMNAQQHSVSEDHQESMLQSGEHSSNAESITDGDQIGGPELPANEVFTVSGTPAIDYFAQSNVNDEFGAVAEGDERVGAPYACARNDGLVGDIPMGEEEELELNDVSPLLGNTR